MRQIPPQPTSQKTVPTFLSVVEPAQALRVVRIRRHSAIKGGAYRYHHADVLVANVEAALDAAAESRVNNWRHFDSFNPGQPKEFTFFEVLVDDLPLQQAVDAAEPDANLADIAYQKVPDFVGDNGVSYRQASVRLEA